MSCIETIACGCGNFSFHVIIKGKKFFTFCPTCGSILELRTDSVMTSKEVLAQMVDEEDEEELSEKALGMIR